MKQFPNAPQRNDDVENTDNQVGNQLNIDADDQVDVGSAGVGYNPNLPRGLAAAQSAKKAQAERDKAKPRTTASSTSTLQATHNPNQSHPSQQELFSSQASRSRTPLQSRDTTHISGNFNDSDLFTSRGSSPANLKPLATGSKNSAMPTTTGPLTTSTTPVTSTTTTSTTSTTPVASTTATRTPSTTPVTSTTTAPSVTSTTTTAPVASTTTTPPTTSTTTSTTPSAVIKGPKNVVELQNDLIFVDFFPEHKNEPKLIKDATNPTLNHYETKKPAGYELNDPAHQYKLVGSDAKRNHTSSAGHTMEENQDGMIVKHREKSGLQKDSPEYINGLKQSYFEAIKLLVAKGITTFEVDHADENTLNTLRTFFEEEAKTLGVAFKVTLTKQGVIYPAKSSPEDQQLYKMFNDEFTRVYGRDHKAVVNYNSSKVKQYVDNQKVLAATPSTTTTSTTSSVAPTGTTTAPSTTVTTTPVTTTPTVSTTTPSSTSSTSTMATTTMGTTTSTTPLPAPISTTRTTPKPHNGVATAAAHATSTTSTTTTTAVPARSVSPLDTDSDNDDSDNYESGSDDGNTRVRETNLSQTR